MAGAAAKPMTTGTALSGFDAAVVLPAELPSLSYLSSAEIRGARRCPFVFVASAAKPNGRYSDARHYAVRNGIPAAAQAAAERLIEEYLVLARHGHDGAGPLFRAVNNNHTAEKLDGRSIPSGIGISCGITACPLAVSGEVGGLASIPHALRPRPTPFRTRPTSQGPGSKER